MKFGKLSQGFFVKLNLHRAFVPIDVVRRVRYQIAVRLEPITGFDHVITDVSLLRIHNDAFELTDRHVAFRDHDHVVQWSGGRFYAGGVQMT